MNTLTTEQRSIIALLGYYATACGALDDRDDLPLHGMALGALCAASYYAFQGVWLFDFGQCKVLACGSLTCATNDAAELLPEGMLLTALDCEGTAKRLHILWPAEPGSDDWEYVWERATDGLLSTDHGWLPAEGWTVHPYRMVVT